jgi:RNA polymerase sigma-70 factor (ECF subfamily)
MSILKDDPEVEDVMQVTYIKAYENLGKFEFKSTFPTWLTRIFINESLLRLKNRKRSDLLNKELINNRITKYFANDTQTPYMKIVNGELKAILEKAILELPEKYRTVFILREIENMNVEET